jgi:hypothetical protein
MTWHSSSLTRPQLILQIYSKFHKTAQLQGFQQFVCSKFTCSKRFDVIVMRFSAFTDEIP